MKLIDLHCDTICKLIESCENTTLYKNNFNVDITKLKNGNSLAQFFALFIDKKKFESPLNQCLKMLDRFYKEIEDNNSYIKLAKNYSDLINNNNENKISAFLTIEEGEALDGNLYNLRNFYRLGVRLITLTWNYPNKIGYPNYNFKYSNKGLTDFGVKTVKEMNKLGILIDVSHLSDKGFYDVAKLSSSPFIASHSNSRTITNHPRNLTDDMIKILSNKGGIIGINFANSFLGKSDISKIDDMITHIKHIQKIGGIEVLSIGSDFDGINQNLEIKNTAEMDKLYFSLSKNKFSDDAIEKIFYKNAIRVIKDVL